MQYRRLGDAGVKLSEIGLGGWLTFGNVVQMDRGREIMDKAFEVGINFFDSANVYSAGKCEECWGELLKSGRRSGYVLATKVYFPMDKGPNDKGLSRKHIMEQCHASLRRLQTDYIDLYQCHRFDEETPLEETIRAMHDLIHQGKILYWGFSEWPVEQVEKCLQICGDRYYKPKGSQPNYSLLQRKVEERIMPLSHRAGIGQVVFCPLAQGVLTGKYKPGQSFPGDSRAVDDRQNMFIKGLVENRATLEKVQRLESVAREQGCTMAQLALAWILRREEVTSCIVGASKPGQVAENAEASGIKLDDATIRRMDEIVS
jgi:voltage-dependent potassium channel beta subunit